MKHIESYDIWYADLPFLPGSYVNMDKSRLKRRISFINDRIDRLCLHQALCIQR